MPTEIIAANIVHLTERYANAFIEEYRQPVTTHMIASLHAGFCAGLEISGYSTDQMLKALEIAHRVIENKRRQQVKLTLIAKNEHKYDNSPKA